VLAWQRSFSTEANRSEARTRRARAGDGVADEKRRREAAPRGVRAVVIIVRRGSSRNGDARVAASVVARVLDSRYALVERSQIALRLLAPPFARIRRGVALV